MIRRKPVTPSMSLTGSVMQHIGKAINVSAWPKWKQLKKPMATNQS
ncbi:MAG: hypothetical protein R3C28_33040 [Pirellulaceae bacterium]